MKLSIRALFWTGGLLWGGSFLLVGLINMAYPDYGKSLLELCGSLYPGYHADQRTLMSVVVGTLYALVDGALGGAVFGWLYNLFAGKS